jgi:hypothetical protein
MDIVSNSSSLSSTGAVSQGSGTFTIGVEGSPPIKMDTLAAMEKRYQDSERIAELEE